MFEWKELKRGHIPRRSKCKIASGIIGRLCCWFAFAEWGGVVEKNEARANVKRRLRCLHEWSCASATGSNQALLFFLRSIDMFTSKTTRLIGIAALLFLSAVSATAHTVRCAPRLAVPDPRSSA